jgi:hypothetical protein
VVIVLFALVVWSYVDDLKKADEYYLYLKKADEYYLSSDDLNKVFKDKE